MHDLGFMGTWQMWDSEGVCLDGNVDLSLWRAGIGKREKKYTRII